MPPKPWESQQRVQKATAITQELQQNQIINKQLDQQIKDNGIGEMTQDEAAQVSVQAANQETTSQTSSLINNLGSSTGLGYDGLNSYEGGYGSMGGYGSGYGGYGSGYGGYGSGYGGFGMGLGYGMGGYDLAHYYKFYQTNLLLNQDSPIIRK